MIVNNELVGNLKEALTICCKAVSERFPEESEENHDNALGIVDLKIEFDRFWIR